MKAVCRGVQGPLLSSASLLKCLQHYVVGNHKIDASDCVIDHSDFVKHDGEELIQRLMEKNNFLRMYGTAREIAEDLKDFTCFVGTRAFFDMDLIEPTDRYPRKHKSMRGKYYINKNDSYAFLLTCFIQLSGDMDNELCCASISFFLRKWLNQLENCNEFVRYDEDEVDDMTEKFKSLLMAKSSPPKKDESRQELFHFKDSYDEIRPQWNSILKIPDGERQYHPIEEALKKFVDKNPIANNKVMYRRMFHFLRIFCASMKETIEAFPHWFLPYPSVTKSVKPLLRIFGHSSKLYLILTEVHKVANDVNKLPPGKSLPLFRQIYAKSRQSAYDGECSLTISVEEFRENIGNEAQLIEFLGITVTNSKYRALPIMKETGKFCLPAPEVLLELLREMIHGYRVFQWPSSVTTPIVEKLFEDFEKYFNPKLDFYFLDYTSIDEMYARVKKEFYFRQAESPTQLLKDARKGGMTLKCLKDELKRLALRDYFPEIVNHAERVFKEIQKTKKGKNLKTCDMFSAVEQCQMSCILIKFPKLAKFLHNQNSCKRVFYDCQFCPKPEVSKVKVKEKIKRITCPHSQEKESFSAQEEKAEGLTRDKSNRKTKSRQSSESSTMSLVSNKESSQESDVKTMKNKCVSTELYDCEACTQDRETAQAVKSTIISVQQKAAKLEKTVMKNEKKKEEAIEKENQVLANRTGIVERYLRKEELIRDMENNITLQRDGLKEHANLKKYTVELEKRLGDLKNSVANCKKNYEENDSYTKRQLTQIKNVINSDNISIGHMKKDLDDLKLCTDAVLEMQRLENELEEEEKETQSLREKNEQLVYFKKRKDNDIQKLYDLEPLLVYSTPTNALFGASTSSSTKNGPKPNTPLTRLLMLENRILSTDPISYANRTANQLINLAGSEVAKRCAKNELKLFYQNFKIHSDALSSNIQKLKENPNMSEAELPPLPKFPSFTDKFMNSLSQLLEKKARTNTDPNKPGCSYSQTQEKLHQNSTSNRRTPAQPRVQTWSRNPPRAESSYSNTTYHEHFNNGNNTRRFSYQNYATSSNGRSQNHFSSRADIHPVQVYQSSVNENLAETYNLFNLPRSNEQREFHNGIHRMQAHLP